MVGEWQAPAPLQVDMLLQDAVAHGGAQAGQVERGRGRRGRGRQARKEHRLGEALVPAIGVQGEGLRIHHVLLELHLGENSYLLVHGRGRVRRRLPALHPPQPRRLAVGGHGSHDRRVPRHGRRRDLWVAHLGGRGGGLSSGVEGQSPAGDQLPAPGRRHLCPRTRKPRSTFRNCSCLLAVGTNRFLEADAQWVCAALSRLVCSQSACSESVFQSLRVLVCIRLACTRCFSPVTLKSDTIKRSHCA